MSAATTMKGSPNDRGPSGCNLDDLSDDLLLRILRFLPFETARRSRHLSTRWRRLPIPLCSLDVDTDDFMPSDLWVLAKFLRGHASTLTSLRLKATLENDLERKVLVMVSYIIAVFAANTVKEACLESHRSISLCQCQLDDALRCCPCLESFSLEQIDGGSPEMQVHAPQLLRLEILESSLVNLGIVASCLMSFGFNCCCKEEDFKGRVCVSRIDGGGCRRLKDLKAFRVRSGYVRVADISSFRFHP